MIENIMPHKVMQDISRKHTLAYASEDPVALNAILCTTSGALYAYKGEESHGISAVYFKGQAIHHLKHELSKTANGALSVSTIYAVSLLLWIEVSSCIRGESNIY